MIIHQYPAPAKRNFSGGLTEPIEVMAWIFNHILQKRGFDFFMKAII